MEGTLISDRSAWTATNNGVDVGTTLFDGNTRTYPSQDASSTVIVNLNSVYPVSYTHLSDRYYPFSSVELSLSSEDTLMINAPLVCDETLQTNDIARIYPDGSFTILGRKDNVINSGGIKIQAEEIEKLLQSFIPVPFVITSVPDQRLGQAVTLFIDCLLYTSRCV